MDHDYLKLKSLIRNFLDSTSSCYSVVDDRCFRELLLYLKPDATLPTSMEMISDRWQKNEELELYQSEAVLPEEPEETSMTVLQFIQSRTKTIVPVRYYREDVKPENIIEEEVVEPMEMKIDIETTDIEIPSEDVPPVESFQTVLSQEIVDRCVVCFQNLNFSGKRKLSIRHGYLIKSICIMNDMYSIEEAKEKGARFYTCVAHLQEMYNLILSTLEIKNLTDITPANPKIFTAFEIVNELKEFRFGRRQSTATSPRYTFCVSIQTFIEAYGPHEHRRYSRKGNFRWPSPSKDSQES